MKISIKISELKKNKGCLVIPYYFDVKQCAITEKTKKRLSRSIIEMKEMNRNEQ